MKYTPTKFHRQLTTVAQSAHRWASALDDWFAAQATIQSSCCHSFSSNSSYTVTATPMPARLRPHLARHIFGANGILTQISCIASQCQDQKLDPRHFANFPTWKWRIGGGGGAARWEVVRVTAKAIWLSWSRRRGRSWVKRKLKLVAIGNFLAQHLPLATCLMPHGPRQRAECAVATLSQLPQLTGLISTHTHT